MFIGHCAAAIGLTAVRPRRGVLTYVATASTLPDLLMLGTVPLGATLNYHADWGMLICLAAVVAIGAVFRFDWRTMALAALGLVVHVPLDIPYVSQDESNLYAHPTTDFALEVGILAVAAGIFVWRARTTGARRTAFVAIVVVLALLQAGWDFGGGFLRF